MLIPRYTLRRLLLLTTAVSLLCFVVARAIAGKAWAFGLSLAAASLLLCFLVYGALFAVAYVLTAIRQAGRPAARAGTPFATAEPPIQMVPPE